MDVSVSWEGVCVSWEGCECELLSLLISHTHRK